MKHIVVLLIVACIVTSARGDTDPVPVKTEETDTIFQFTQEMCPSPERFLSDTTKVGIRCIEMGALKSKGNVKGKTLEEIREAFAQFCQRKPIIQQCLLEASTQIDLCHNETFVTLFKINRDLIETLLEFGCSDAGVRFSNLVHEVIESFYEREVGMSIRHCFNKNQATLTIIEFSDVDIPTKLYNLHRDMTSLVECLNHVGLSTSIKDSMKLFFDEMINKMKCVHPSDGVLIPCAEIDAVFFSVTNVCDMKTLGTNMSLYDMLEDESISFLMSPSQYQESEIIDDDKIRELIEANCQSFGAFHYTSVVSEICLNGTEQKEFLLLGDVVKSGYEAGCRDNGTLFKKIMIGVYRLKNSGHGHAVWDCVDAVDSARNEVDEHHTSSSKNMRFYHEMETFKECLVDKLGDDVTSVAAATSLIDETMRAAKCVHPEDRTTILCETLLVKA